MTPDTDSWEYYKVESEQCSHKQKNCSTSEKLDALEKHKGVLRGEVLWDLAHWCE